MTSGPEIRPVERTKHVRMALYGDPGVGKTRLIGSSPGRVLLVRPPTDHTDAIRPTDRRRIKEIVVSDWDGMSELLDFLRHEGAKFDWVWVDSISLLQDHLLDDIWETTIAEKPARARYGLDQQEYGINFFRLAAWIRHVVGPDLFNFGFTAHVAELLPSPDPEIERKLMPWIQGKNMSPKFCGYMKVVAFMEVAKIGGKEGRRVLRLSASDRYYAKDQFDMTPDGRVIDPTMPKIVDLINKSRTNGAAPTSAARRPRVTARKRVGGK